jgi:8-oxo-dGTP pyrophosphatase MutT (NUDIX family)
MDAMLLWKFNWRHRANLSSVLLISSKNELLLLHRVKTSSSFASAHVFPGGNLSAQDGPCPPPEDLARHEDSPSYRRAAIRELFEESGILLAKNRTSGKLIAVDEPTREAGRRLIHQNKTTFDEWLKEQDNDADPDLGELL